MVDLGFLLDLDNRLGSEIMQGALDPVRHPPQQLDEHRTDRILLKGDVHITDLLRDDSVIRSPLGIVIHGRIGGLAVAQQPVDVVEFPGRALAASLG
jgi:hypothetical protein